MLSWVEIGCRASGATGGEENLCTNRVYIEVAKKPEVIYNFIQLMEVNEKLILIFDRYLHLRIKFLMVYPEKHPNSVKPIYAC